MLKRVTILSIVILLVCMVSFSEAALEATGNVAPLYPGNNILAGGAFNDSAGSSDLTLIIQLTADSAILIDEGSACKVIQPLENIPSDGDPRGWTEFGFNDSSWDDGVLGIGYGDGDDNTVIGDGSHAAVYCRAPFVVDSPGSVGSLTLGADYDDACVIWINGVEVARTPDTDIPDEPEWDSWSDQGSGQSHEASKANPPNYETVDLKFEMSSAVRPQDKLTVLWGGLKK